MSNTMYKLYHLKKQIIKQQYEEMQNADADTMQAYLEWADHQSKVDSKTHFRICTNEITAMFAERDGKKVKLICSTVDKPTK